jgi:probable rRNA maturation factor
MRDLQINNEANLIDTASIPFKNVLIEICNEFRLSSCEISLALIDDAQMHQLNRQFLAHDEPTDVLTFPGLEHSPDSLSGEIIISVDTARRCAAEWGTGVEGELLLYFIHGLLHLLGYDDLRESDAARMREMEKKFLEQAGFPYRFEGIDQVGET